MNIRYDVVQGSAEWFSARAGFLSASCFGEIFTPTGKEATGAKVENYANRLISERITGKPCESGFSSAAMERGHIIEIEARAFYEMTFDIDVTQVGLVENGDYSCSPDGLIMEGGQIIKGLEIKSPLAHTQIGYLKKGVLPTQYIPQVQGSMFVCEVNQWDFLSYHPDLKPLLLTIERDQEWLDNLSPVAEEFLNRVKSGVQQLSNEEVTS